MRLMHWVFCLHLAAIALGVAQAKAQGPSGKLIETHRSPRLGLEFVAVPGSAALIAKHEVTVAQWQEFLRDSGYVWDFKAHFEQGQDHPAVGISLQDARAFCNWLTRVEQQGSQIAADQLYRLPTREDWDAAVALLRRRKTDLTVEDVAEDEKTHPWGLSWPPPKGVGNFAEGITGYQDEFRFTAPVGRFTPSAEGIHDLAGNVWEWVWDPEIRAEQQGLLRGGSWAYFREECLRSGFTMPAPADLRMATFGMRPVFEDRARLASMLANLEADREKVRASLRRQMLGEKVAPGDVESMRRKLVAKLKGEAPNQATKDDRGAKAVVPAAAGRDFVNSTGLKFLPLSQQTLVAIHECRLSDVLPWFEESRTPWPQRPAFLTQDNHPAVGLSWDMATAYAQWLTKREQGSGHLAQSAAYRLPSDVEWSQWVGLGAEVGNDPESRSGQIKDHFPWPLHRQFPPIGQGVNLDAGRLQGFSDPWAYTGAADAESVNAMGLRGLGGNAAEWCSDPWPSASRERVVRGGSWLGWDRESLLSSSRRHAPADQGAADIGLRLVLQLNAR